jgi:hypothetical protein
MSKPRLDVISLRRFSAQQLSDLTGPMEHRALLAFWFFIARYAAPSVIIIIPPDASYLRQKTS